MHTAISSHTPPGQGGLGRETVVGSSPSILMMAHITNRGSSSSPFPHAYTLLRCCRRPRSVCKFFRGHSVGGCPRSCRTFCTGSTSCDRTTGTPRQRPPSSNLISNSPSLGRPFGASRLRALTLHAEHELQHSCLPLCAGSKLNIPPLHPEHQSPWILATGALCRPTRPIGPSRSSPSPNVLALGRTARDTLNGQSRARAPRVRSLSEGAARTRLSC